MIFNQYRDSTFKVKISFILSGIYLILRRITHVTFPVVIVTRIWKMVNGQVNDCKILTFIPLNYEKVNQLVKFNNQE